MKKSNGAGKDKRRMHTVMWVSGLTMAVNFLLSAGKLLAGMMGHSDAMISDAVHSASDVLSTVIVMAGIAIAAREADSNHPYGHERFESIASFILAGLLGGIGIMIGYKGLLKILEGELAGQVLPGRVALAAALISILVKEWMFWYTRAASVKTGSPALMADAWHHRSDALSSVGSLIGIFGARHGYPFMDALASIIICFFILKAAYSIGKDAVNSITDRACNQETEGKIKNLVIGVPGVMRLDSMRTRVFGNRILVDLEIAVDPNMPLLNAHEIGDSVEEKVLRKVAGVKQCMIHINPYQLEEDGDLAGNGI